MDAPGPSDGLEKSDPDQAQTACGGDERSSPDGEHAGVPHDGDDRDPLYPVPPPTDASSPRPGSREKLRLASLPANEKLAMVVSADAAAGGGGARSECVVGAVLTSNVGAAGVELEFSGQAQQAEQLAKCPGSQQAQTSTVCSGDRQPDDHSSELDRDPLYPVPPPTDASSPRPGSREKLRLASLPANEKLAMVVSVDAAAGGGGARSECVGAVLTSNVGAAGMELDFSGQAPQAEQLAERLAGGFAADGTPGGEFSATAPPPGLRFSGYLKGATGIVWEPDT